MNLQRLNECLGSDFATIREALDWYQHLKDRCARPVANERDLDRMSQARPLFDALDTDEEEDNPGSQAVTIDGVTVYFYRSLIDGKLVVDIDSGEASDPRDTEPDHVPTLRVIINEDVAWGEE